jgi:hypothetical protein
MQLLKYYICDKDYFSAFPVFAVHFEAVRLTPAEPWFASPQNTCRFEYGKCTLLFLRRKETKIRSKTFLS